MQTTEEVPTTRSPAPRVMRWVSAILILILIAAACGDEDDTDEGTVEAGTTPATAATPNETPTATTDPTPSDPTPIGAPPRETVEWVEAVREEWGAMAEERWILAVDRRSAAETDSSAVPHVAFTRGLADLHDVMADKVGEAPIWDGTAASAGSFEVDLRNAALDLRDLADELELVPDFAEAQLAPHGDAEDERVAAALQACFSFQDAVATLGLPLVDCARTGGGEGLWTPGTYDIEEFARPLQLSFDETVNVNVGTRVIEIDRTDPDYFPGAWAFWIVAVHTLPAPGTLGNITETVPYSADLGEWLAEFPTGISRQGITELSDAEAPYWSVPLPAEGEDVPMWTLAIDESGGPVSVVPLRAGSTVWHIPHDAGPLMVVAATKFAIPGAPDLAEITAYVEQVLQTLKPLDDVPPLDFEDPTPSGPGDPGLDELREAMRSVGEEYVGDRPNEAWIDCDTPEVGPVVVPLAAPRLDIDLNGRGIVELSEFASKGERDRFFGAAETVIGECSERGGGFLTFERTLIDEHTEAGSQIAADVIVIFSPEDPDAEGEEERFTATTLWRTVGAVGILAIEVESFDDAQGLIEQLGLA